MKELKEQLVECRHNLCKLTMGERRVTKRIQDKANESATLDDVTGGQIPPMDHHGIMPDHTVMCRSAPHLI